jgi:hypothetical protein
LNVLWWQRLTAVTSAGSKSHEETNVRVAELTTALIPRHVSRMHRAVSDDFCPAPT